MVGTRGERASHFLTIPLPIFQLVYKVELWRLWNEGICMDIILQKRVNILPMKRIMNKKMINKQIGIPWN